MSKNKKTVFCESEEITIEDNPFGYFKDGLLYCKTENGKVIVYSSYGMSRLYIKPRLPRYNNIDPEKRDEIIRSLRELGIEL